MTTENALMPTSNGTGRNIYQRIAAACKSISTIVKTGQIQTKNRTYTVATQSDVLLPVRDAINQNGLAFTSKIKSWSLATQKGKNSYGQEIDLTVLTLTMEYCLINMDNPAECISVDWPIVCSDEGGEIHKLFGKALTYALKYYFIQTFMLPRDDDDPDLDKNKDKDKDKKTESDDVPPYNSLSNKNGNGGAKPQQPPAPSTTQNGNGKSSNQPVHYENEDEVVYQDRCRLFNQTIAYMKAKNINLATVKAICEELGIKQDSFHMSRQEFVQLLNTLQERQEALEKQQAAKDTQEHAPLTQEETTPPPVNNDPPAPFTPPANPFEAPKEDAKKN